MLQSTVYTTTLLGFLLVSIWPTVTNCYPKDCEAIKNAGYRCKNNTEPRIAYYYDSETALCLPFLYEGCGGNENRFSDIEICRINCIPQDNGWCAMKEKAYEDNNTNTMICSGENFNQCPEKYMCKHLAFFGICCPRKIEEMFIKNFNPSCTKGNVVKFDDGSIPVTLLGRSCNDKFCPKNSNCFEQEIFAYCCQ